MSAPIPVNASHPGVDNSWCLIDEIVAPEKRPAQQPRRLEKYAPVVKANYVNFSFAFLPCHKVLPYEQAVVSVFQVPYLTMFKGGGHCVFKWILHGHFKPPRSATI